MVIPSASRLMTSLRDIGYTAPAAVADLVDNSIDADAATTRITVSFRGADSFIRIADDGNGMTERVLDEAMRYGTRRRYGAADLGRFGLGLKTASLSQCRRMTVATRSTLRGRIRIRRWDLDHVQTHDRWDLQTLTPSECPPLLLEPLRKQIGTVVLWDRLDRMLEYAHPHGEKARKGLEALSDEIREHLSMVFHRYLEKWNGGEQALGIIFNGEPLTAWDPYALAEPGTRSLPVQRIPFDHEGKTHVVLARPYVLPSQSRFSTPDAHALASGPALWNRQQGFYIYRGRRLIQSGGWNRLRTMDEHSKLARIAIEMPSGVEEAFQINVAKMSASIPADLRPRLRALAAGIVAEAQSEYRHHQVTTEATGEGTEIEATMGAIWPTVAYVVHRELADMPEVRRRLLLALANTRPTGVEEEPVVALLAGVGVLEEVRPPRRGALAAGG